LVSYEVCKASFKVRLRETRSFLRQPFQHRRDHVDVDGVLDLHIVIAIGRLFAIDVVGREPGGRCLDLELSVEHVGLVELCDLVAGLGRPLIDGIDCVIDRLELRGFALSGFALGGLATRGRLGTGGIEIHRARLLRTRRGSRHRLEPGRATVVVRLPIVPIDATILDADASSACEAIDDAGEEAGERQRATDHEQQRLERAGRFIGGGICRGKRDRGRGF